MTSRPRSWPLLIVGLLCGVGLGIIATAALAVAVLVASGGLVGDEWQCSFGEYPVSNRAGGGSCVVYGDPPPGGSLADPAGNQRLGVTS